MSNDWPQTQVKAAFGYWALLAAYYSGAVVAAFLLVRFLPHGGVLVALLLVQIIVMSGATLLALMYEEDWWNDFKDQNRAVILGLAGNVASVALGAWLAQSF